MSPPARDERLARIRIQRLAQLGTLLAGFAHEIRNPLSTIGLNLQLVLEEFRDAESARDKRTKKRLVTVEAEVRRLQKILRRARCEKLTHGCSTRECHVRRWFVR